MRTALTTAFVLLCVLSGARNAEAAYMSPISDLITTSNPSTGASHIIIFRVHNAVPASGTVTVTPEGAFTIPLGFDFNDVDMAVSNGGPYVERELAGIPSALNDGVAINGDSVQITLNSVDAIPANALVRIVLGTGASHQSVGDTNPVNPATAGSYRVRIDTANGASHIDDAKAMIVVVLPISTSLTMPYLAPVISNALPSGTIAAGSATVELSFETDKVATCRYATSSGMTYASMTNTFSSIAGLLFYTVIGGHVDGQTYTYYVRCSDQSNLVNLDDYPITFTLAPTPSITSSDGTTPGSGQSSSGGSGGSGGVGSFAGGSSVLFLSNVTISGKGPVGASVSFLRDGKLALTKQANSDGVFSATISGLERGTYTFVAFATDGAGNKTSRFASTFTLNSGTNNAIAGVLLSPTVAADSESVDIGSDVHVSGVGVPGTTVSLSVRDVPENGPAGTPKEYTASTSPTGAWEYLVPAKSLSRGTYELKAKTVSGEATSEFSPASYVGYGQSPSQKAASGNRSDINGDGKVNLVDFSILLTHWGQSDEAADINQDGTVNLADFSILLFNWTG